MNDIETRIRELLNESVDAELGPRRPAPPFEPPAVSQPRRWVPWATPLLAAAAVAALIGGTVAVAHVATNHRHRPPATSVPPPTPTPTPTPPTHTSTPPTKPTTRARTSVVAGTTATGAGNTVQVPSDLKQWILGQPHPQVTRGCIPGDLEILASIQRPHLTAGTVPDAVAAVDCRDATSGQPFEIDVYGAVGDHYGLVYRVRVATETNGVGRVNGEFSISGNVLTVLMGGYTQTDPKCCASSQWKQDYTFDGTSVTQGPLVETSGPNLFTSVGPVQLGMTAAQVHAAEPSLRSHSFGTGCSEFGSAGTSQPHAVLTPPTNRVIGIDAPSGYRTDTGIGVGATAAQIRAAYAGRHIEEASSQDGQVMLVQGSSSWLGFRLGSGTTVKSISVGNHDFAAQYEYCVSPGPMPS